MGIQCAYNWSTMGLQWVYNESTMGLPCVYNGYTMDLQCVYNGYTIGLQCVYNESSMCLQWNYNGYTIVIQHGETEERPTAKRRADSCDTACGLATKTTARECECAEMEHWQSTQYKPANQHARQANKRGRAGRPANMQAKTTASRAHNSIICFCCASAYAAPVSHITNAGSDDSSDDSSSGHFQHGGVACPAGNESVSACRTDSYPAGQGTPIAEDKAPVARPSSAESPNASRRSSASTCGNTILRHGSNM
jgi:hypothetical protein